MKIWKILTGLLLMFLLIGTVTAFEIDSLKTTDDYTDIQDKCATYTTNENRFIFVEQMNDYADFFVNDTATQFMVIPVEDNIFYFEDDGIQQYGYQEMVNIDGDYYMVSVNQLSKLSPSEKNEFLKDLQEFNKLNNLEPVEV